MEIQLLVTLKASSEKFMLEDFCPDDNIFALVCSGQFVFTSPEGTFTVDENQGALFRKDVMVHRYVTRPITWYLFRYRSDVPLFFSDYIIFKDISRIKTTIAMAEQLTYHMPHNKFYYLSHVFSDLVNQYALEGISTGSDRHRVDSVIETAMKMIQENLHQKLILTEIAQNTGLSYVQFLRRFRAYTGLTPSDYVNTLRIQKAKELLSNTDALVKDIAADCGFENEYYFSNSFKKEVGMSPSSFRKL